MNKDSKKLGMGLGALLNSNPQKKNNINKIDITKITPNNNILDLSSGIDCLKEFLDPTCVIIKHNNPCGVASGKTIKNAFKKAYFSDSHSAFGGIVMLNKNIDKSLAQILSKKFFEIIAAPSFSSEAERILKQKRYKSLLIQLQIKDLSNQ